MGDYRRLKVWARAHELALDIYRSTGRYPSAELYGLISQTRRAAASIPMNIAEGCGRNSDGELRRFCNISLGSANELEYQLLLARDLGFLESADHADLTRRAGEIRRMLAALADTVART